jgi:hypothetical protein
VAEKVEAVFEQKMLMYLHVQYLCDFSMSMPIFIHIKKKALSSRFSQKMPSLQKESSP